MEEVEPGNTSYSLRISHIKRYVCGRGFQMDQKIESTVLLRQKKVPPRPYRYQAQLGLVRFISTLCRSSI